MKTLIKEGLAQLDNNTLDGFNIASTAEKTANKILRVINMKKNKSGDGSRVKTSKQTPPKTSTPQPESDIECNDN